MYSHEYNDLLNRITELRQWLVENTPTVLELQKVRAELMSIVQQMQKQISVIEARYRDLNNKIQMLEKEIEELKK